MTPFTKKELLSAVNSSRTYFVESQKDDLRRIIKRLKAGNTRILKKDVRRVLSLARQELER